MPSIAHHATPFLVGEDEWLIDEVSQLVENLEGFAFQAERVLTKLDIRAARQARHIARQLRLFASSMELASDSEMRDSASARLVELIVVGHLQLGLGEHADVGEREPPLISRAQMVTASESRIRAVADDTRSTTPVEDPRFRRPTEPEVPGEMRRISDQDAAACQTAWTSLLAK